MKKNSWAASRNKAFGLTALVLVFLLMCGFDFSNPDRLRRELRREIRAELEKIIEKTPSGRLRAIWRQKKKEAEQTLNHALVLDAPRFCPEKWDEAVMLFKKAKKYASKTEYRKAIYLAKKTKEFASLAGKCAEDYIKAHDDRLGKRYRFLRTRMDEIMAMIPQDAEDLVAQAASLSLKVEDLKSAIDLRQYEDADELAKVIEKKLTRLEGLARKYKMEHEQSEEL